VIENPLVLSDPGPTVDSCGPRRLGERLVVGALPGFTWTPARVRPLTTTPDFERQIQALRVILLVNERAMFEFVVTPATLQEVNGRKDRRYVRWVNDVRDTWLVQSAGEDLPPWGETSISRPSA
jgi:hypothetical protein